MLTVCTAGCTYSSMSSAVQSAPAHATLLVRGAQSGNAIIDRPLTLRGDGTATISGGSSGIVVRASGVRIEGLRFEGYGTSDRSGRSAAVVLEAGSARVRFNQFSGNAFAITAFRAPGAVIEGNRIDGLAASNPQDVGDSIRLWYSPFGRIVANTLTNGRDILISYSPHVSVTGNTIASSRYGLHDMFSDSMIVDGNTFEGNEIGANFMYVRRLEITHNVFRANHGAAGYGLGMEDVDGSRISANRFEQNHVGVTSIDSPTDPQTPDALVGNVFSHNGSALTLQSDPHALKILGNAFADNVEDVEVSGGGVAQGVTWTAAGHGNFWSRYAGYDRNADGIGDVPYAPQGAFDSLTDLHPELQMFRYSPAALAVEFAARALPAVAAAPKLRDTAPLIDAPAIAPPAKRNPLDRFGALLALLCAVPLAAMRAARIGKKAARLHALNQPAEDVVLEAISIRKLYEAHRGVSDLSLIVKKGESVALWGANGAGKTTFFRCILGERLDSGTLRICGHVPTPHDRSTRSAVGYAPQHLPDFDASVGELAGLVAALRGVTHAQADRALARVGLEMENRRGVNELSGGMRQRLAIALALIGDPPVLLLDEPTAGLDRASRETVIALLQKERARGKTIIFTSHLLEDVRALSDRVVTLEGGVTVESVPAEYFTTRYLRNIS